MNAHQERAIKALEQSKGDDAYRARMAFRNFSPQQMQEIYGDSGQTCQEILNEYEAHDRRCNEAIEWIKAAHL